MELKRSGVMIPFLDLRIGDPFYAHGRVFTRTDFSSGTELLSTKTERGMHVPFGQAFDFLIDGTAEPLFGPYSHPGETCELVEALILVL